MTIAFSINELFFVS